MRVRWRRAAAVYNLYPLAYTSAWPSNLLRFSRLFLLLFFFLVGDYKRGLYPPTFSIYPGSLSFNRLIRLIYAMPYYVRRSQVHQCVPRALVSAMYLCARCYLHSRVEGVTYVYTMSRISFLTLYRHFFDTLFLLAGGAILSFRCLCRSILVPFLQKQLLPLFSLLYLSDRLLLQSFKRMLLLLVENCISLPSNLESLDLLQSCKISAFGKVLLLTLITSFLNNFVAIKIKK